MTLVIIPLVISSNIIPIPEGNACNFFINGNLYISNILKITYPAIARYALTGRNISDIIIPAISSITIRWSSFLKNNFSASVDINIPAITSIRVTAEYSNGDSPDNKYQYISMPAAVPKLPGALGIYPVPNPVAKKRIILFFILFRRFVYEYFFMFKYITHSGIYCYQGDIKHYPERGMF